MNDQRAREADPLAHAAGQLARIGGFEPVEADQVDGRQRALADLRRAACVCASRPSATFSNTVSQGNSAKLWNTMAMPRAGPATGLPEVAAARPRSARQGPRSGAAASTCPSPSGRAAPRSALRAAPGSCLRAPAAPRRPASEMPCGRRCIASNGLQCSWPVSCQVSPIFALGVVIQGPPEEPVDRRPRTGSWCRSRARCDESPRVAAAPRCRTPSPAARICVCPQVASSATMRRVPRSARSGDRAGDVERKHGRQRHLPPPQPAA